MMNRLKLIIATTVWRIENIFATAKKTKQKNDDLKKNEFSSSTKKIGVTFNEKIRDNFREKWIRKSKNKGSSNNCF